VRSAFWSPRVSAKRVSSTTSRCDQIRQRSIRAANSGTASASRITLVSIETKHAPAIEIIAPAVTSGPNTSWSGLSHVEKGQAKDQRQLQQRRDQHNRCYRDGRIE